VLIDLEAAVKSAFGSTVAFCFFAQTNSTLMRTLIQSTLLFTALALGSFAQAQTESKKTLAVLDFDVRNYPVDAQQLIDKATIELIRINKFEIVDKYDIEYISKRDKVDLKGCYSKICLEDIGKRLKCDFLLTGSYDVLGDRVAVTVRLYDVAKGSFTESASRVYLNIPQQNLTMMEVAVKDLLAVPNDENLIKKLTISEEYESALNNPETAVINNNGPRLGVTGVFGPSQKILMADPKTGGFGYSLPALTSFGYQFEQVFVNSGDFQALFEFIPLIAGLEYGRVIPSANVLMGMRNSRTGWEFAVGPNFTTTVTAEGYLEGSNFILRGSAGYNPMGKDVITRLDSRGDLTVSTGLVLGFGKTFKSGKMNFPINVFVVTPGRGDSWRIGTSVGFNIVRKKTPSFTPLTTNKPAAPAASGASVQRITIQ
jgi:TolB-like protein